MRRCVAIVVGAVVSAGVGVVIIVLPVSETVEDFIVALRVRLNKWNG